MYWAGDKTHYSGKVKAVNRAKRTISVDYDAGDHDETVNYFEVKSRRESRFAREGGMADGMSDYVVEMTRK